MSKFAFALAMCLFVGLGSPVSVKAQSLGDQLLEQLAGRTRLFDIMPVVDSFYLAQSDGIRENGGDGLPKYKHWKRWEWYMARRLGPDGEFVHIPRHNLEMLERERSRSVPRRQSTMPGEWESIGIAESSYSPSAQASYANGTGRVDRIAFHPTDPDILYVGSPHGGLWRTMDGGDTWEPLTDMLPSIGVSGIVVTPSDPDRIYMLTGTGDDYIGSFYELVGLVSPSLGVMQSLDGGESWTFTDTFPNNGARFAPYDLVQSPGHPDTLLAATSIGIFRTINGGDDWTLVRAGLHYDLEFKPGSNDVIYAATDTKIFHSQDAGATWTESTLSPAPGLTPQRIALGVSPAAPDVVYAFLGNGSTYWSGFFAGLYLSNDAGVEFQRQSETPNVLGYSITGGDGSSQAFYDLCMAVHPTNAAQISLGSINIWRSVDSGVTLTNNTGWREDQGALQYVHCDHHAMAYNPLDNKLYFCNDGGIWVTSDSGDSCTNISYGLVLSQLFHLSQYQAAPHKMLGGLQDNGVKYRADGVGDFVHMHGADGFSSGFAAENPNTLFASVNSTMIRVDAASGIATYINNWPLSSMFFKELLAHPMDSNILFAGAEQIFRSTNQGSSWTNVGGSGSWALACAPSHPDRMYAAGSVSQFWPGVGTAHTSADGGLTWTLISGNPGFPGALDLVTDIEVHPIDSHMVYMTFGSLFEGQKVYMSTNAGQTWTNISYDLPNIATLSIAVTPDELFVGTDFTVYHLPHGDTTWMDIGENMPNTPVTELLYSAGSGTLTAATYGRGVWQRNICVEDMHVDYPLSGSLQFSCDNLLTSTALISGHPIDSVEFRANGKIRLMPGFRAGTGAFFKAALEACDQGMLPFQGLPPDQQPPLEGRPTAVRAAGQD